jgi:uncharacterized membrane protein
VTAPDPLRRAWEDLPLFYLWLSPFAVLNLEVVQLGMPAAPALRAFALPWLLGCLALRRAPHARPTATVILIASGGLLAAILAGWSGARLSPEAVGLVTEVAALGAFVLLATHAAVARGTGKLAGLLGVGLLYGLILENGGVALGFFSEDRFRIRLPLLPAPLATSLGWCLVFYPLWHAAPLIAGRGAAAGHRALVATGMALALDLQLDPAATAAGFWVWPPSPPPVVRGVPAVNFCAWFAAVLPFAFAAFEATRSETIDAARLARSLPRILLEALALVVAALVVVEASLGWPSILRLAEPAISLLRGL